MTRRYYAWTRSKLDRKATLELEKRNTEIVKFDRHESYGMINDAKEKNLLNCPLCFDAHARLVCSRPIACTGRSSAGSRFLADFAAVALFFVLGQGRQA